MSGDMFADARWLIKSVADALRRRSRPGIDESLSRLEAQDLSMPRVPAVSRLPVCRYLAETVSAAMLVDAGVAAAAAACLDDMEWRHTPGYSDKILGEGFMDDYGHCELIGSHGVFAGDDFRLGFLLLGPHRHYRDHYHPAPELYWPLTGPTQWKRGDGAFETRQAGDTIWHEPNVIHATRTLDVPMLALWIWTKDTAISAKIIDGA